MIEGNPTDNKFSGTKMNPQKIKTANNKPSNSKGYLYYNYFKTVEDGDYLGANSELRSSL
jgi:hypothetical protein